MHAHASHLQQHIAGAQPRRRRAARSDLSDDDGAAAVGAQRAPTAPPFSRVGERAPRLLRWCSSRRRRRAEGRRRGRCRRRRRRGAASQHLHHEVIVEDAAAATGRRRRRRELIKIEKGRLGRLAAVRRRRAWRRRRRRRRGGGGLGGGGDGHHGRAAARDQSILQAPACPLLRAQRVERAARRLCGLERHKRRRCYSGVAGAAVGGGAAAGGARRRWRGGVELGGGLRVESVKSRARAASAAAGAWLPMPPRRSPEGTRRCCGRCRCGGAGAAAARVNGVARARRRPRIGGGRRICAVFGLPPEPEPERPRCAAAAAGCGARLGGGASSISSSMKRPFCIRPAVIADAHWPATKAESAVSEANLPMLRTKPRRRARA